MVVSTSNPLAAELRQWLREPVPAIPVPSFTLGGLARALEPSVRSAKADRIHPKLRNDAIFLPSRDGVVLRSDRQSIFLPGYHLYPLLAALAPQLTGRRTLAELCAPHEAPGCDNLDRLIRLLLEAGILIDQPLETAGAPEAVVRRFESAIDFLGHIADRPQERFARFRASRVLLAGEGRVLGEAAAALIGYGLERLEVAPLSGAGEEWRKAGRLAEKLTGEGVPAEVRIPGAAQAGDFDAIAYCSDRPNFGELLLLNRACCQEGRSFLPGLMIGGHAVLGPWMRPWAAACWVCGMARLSEAMDDETGSTIRQIVLRRTTAVPAPSNIGLCEDLGRDLALELLKELSGGRRLQYEGAMLLQSAQEDGSVSAALIPHSLCSCLDYCEPYARSAG